MRGTPKLKLPVVFFAFILLSTLGLSLGQPYWCHLHALEKYLVIYLKKGAHNLTGHIDVILRRYVSPSSFGFLKNSPIRNSFSGNRVHPLKLHSFLRKSEPDGLNVPSVSAPTMTSGSYSSSASHAPASITGAPSRLSTPLLVAMASGIIIILSMITIVLHCCVNYRRKRRKKNELERAAERSAEADSDSEKREWWSDEFRHNVLTSERRISPPSILEFSPPSPTWRPTLPSFAFVVEKQNAPCVEAKAITAYEQRWCNDSGGWDREVQFVTPLPRIHGSTPIRTVAPPLPPLASKTYRSPKVHQNYGVTTTAAPRAVACRATVEYCIPQQSRPPYVPRIQIHPAQDNLTPSVSLQKSLRRIQPPRINEDPEAGRADVVRNNSTKSSRPVSGLGISTIDFDEGNITSLRIPNATNSTTKSAVCKSLKLTVAPSPFARLNDGSCCSTAEFAEKSSISSLDEVKLAYTVSMSSLGSAPGKETESTDWYEQGIKANAKQTGVHDWKTGAANQNVNAHAGDAATDDGSRQRKPASAGVTIANHPITNTVYTFESYPDQKTVTAVPNCSSPLPLMRSASSKRSNMSKRQGLGVGTIDESTKSELHGMRSLGSESFDSLIAYLSETVEPGVSKRSSFPPSSPMRSPNQDLTNELEHRADSPPKMMTREDTMRLDPAAFKAWVGDLNASTSVLRLAHVNIADGKEEDRRVGCSSRGVSQSVSKEKRKKESESTTTAKPRKRDIIVDTGASYEEGRLVEKVDVSAATPDGVRSVSSLGSNASSLGLRQDWGRESLTPRFNHLRAVLEGRFEDPPPLPSHEAGGLSKYLEAGTPGTSKHRTLSFSPSAEALADDWRTSRLPVSALNSSLTVPTDRNSRTGGDTHSERVVLDRGRIYPSNSNNGVSSGSDRKADGASGKDKLAGGEWLFDARV
ncbi:hypothetical protein EW145_g5962 [Phellinidium pouzarii]|uniref:Uncharacterized protein n=1 Tax=Phellinidium pouzarii TaxID=167371 RepID=A0A4S4L2X9_9AGAM|nr:hypothetical protein EW145_g5962 [Phellinidium pouzarii]